MHTAIVTVPNAFLYENLIDKRISDELLSGWPVTVQQQQDTYLKVTTHYGYTGWLRASAVRSISPEEYTCWNPWDVCNRETGILQEKHILKDTGQTENHFAILCRGITDILKQPKVQANILSTLFMGSTVISIGAAKKGWQKIKTAEEICGYVPSISLLYPQNLKSCSLVQLRSAIINYAKSYLGIQYRWGGKTHAGIDCSGLTFMSYYMCGIKIYRDAAIVDGYPVQEIPFSQIQPADLLYFPGHIALYLGNGRYIHSTGNPASFGCVINSLNPQDSNYRKDLADSLCAVGSVFS